MAPVVQSSWCPDCTAAARPNVQWCRLVTECCGEWPRDRTRTRRFSATRSNRRSSCSAVGC